MLCILLLSFRRFRLRRCVSLSLLFSRCESDLSPEFSSLCLCDGDHGEVYISCHGIAETYVLAFVFALRPFFASFGVLWLPLFTSQMRSRTLLQLLNATWPSFCFLRSFIGVVLPHERSVCFCCFVFCVNGSSFVFHAAAFAFVSQASLTTELGELKVSVAKRLGALYIIKWVFFFSTESDLKQCLPKITLVLYPVVLPAFDTLCLSFVLQVWKHFECFFRYSV